MRLLLSTWLALCWLASVQAVEPKPLGVAVGQEFKITLPANATTGYQWVLAQPPDENLVRVLKSDYKRSNSKLMGASGNITWTFKALAAGQTEMKLKYARPWEKTEPPAQTTNYVIVIKAAKAGGKQ
jgi:inhibitor of cysteine peptidase